MANYHTWYRNPQFLLLKKLRDIICDERATVEQQLEACRMYAAEIKQIHPRTKYKRKSDAASDRVAELMLRIKEPRPE